MLEKIKAVMLGHAVADALGVPVEFRSRKSLDEEPLCEMIGWGTHKVPEGSWSDDTSMALATLDSLKNGNVDYEGIMKNFVAWSTLNEYTPTGMVYDIGNACLTAIGNYMMGNSKPAIECGLANELSNGNGSLMRIHPMTLYLFDRRNDPESLEIIHNTSSLTHAHERSKIACGIYSFLLWELLSENTSRGDKEAIKRGVSRARDYYSDNPEFSHYEERLCRQIVGIGHDADFAPLERGKIKSSGYVVDTLEAAVWCLMTTNDYKSCVLKAANLGDDTDTVAAIAGGLAGALYGFESIPGEWLSKLKRRDYIEKMCEDAWRNWTTAV